MNDFNTAVALLLTDPDDRALMASIRLSSPSAEYSDWCEYVDAFWAWRNGETE